MVPRKVPTPVTHFTHVDHLATVIEHGLLSDSSAHARRVLAVEVGDLGIKDRRRRREVPVRPGGQVADYVPFYFATRSPMMFSISKGNVSSYHGGTARLIYLVTTLERLHECGHPIVLSDRNAVYAYASFREFDPADPIDDDFIDWDVMRARYWDDFPDGKERRMAEALVHDRVAWEAISRIGVQSDVVADEVRLILASAGVSVPVDVRPQWYF